MTFLDTSLVVRFFLREEGTERVERLLSSQESIAVSALIDVEFRSAVARRRRTGDFGTSEEDALVGMFESGWTGAIRVPVSSAILLSAGVLVKRHPLRSLDAIHLASALRSARDAPVPVRFGSTDARLNAAAEAEGLELIAAG